MRAKEAPFVSRSQPRAGFRRDATSEKRASFAVEQGVLELRSVNVALAKQLAQERAEHEKDVTEANGTIRRLHAALSQMQDQLEASKHQQNQRVKGVATSLRGLQEQLRLQEDSKISSEGRAQQLAEFVCQLRRQTDTLHLHVKERDGQLSVLRSEYDDARIKLTAANKSEEAACARLATLEIEVAKGRSDLSTSSACVQQLEGTFAHVQQELEQLRVKEQKAVEDLIMAQDTAAKKRSECEHLKHLLDNERKLHEKSQEDVKGLQAENKDLILQTANARALACSVEELKGQLTKVQAERDTMDTCVMARSQEFESLTAENLRLKSDWKLREDGLSSSHAIRIQHLMKSIQEREQQNCDLHNSMHKAKVRIETLEAESETTRQQSEKASEAILSLEQSCTDLKRELEEDKAQSRHLLTEAVEANRSNSSKLAQCDTELAKTKQHCHDLQTRIESLLLQMQNQMTAYAALKQQLQDAEQNSAEQGSKLTASIREVSEKLLDSQRQHDHALATADSKIQQLTRNLNGALSEAAAVKAALETAALENESSQNKISALQQELNIRTGEVGVAQKKLESCIDEVEALKSSLRQKQDDVESITKRQEKMVKVVTNAMNVEEQAKLTAQKQLRSAKDRVSQLDRELTDMMGKLADANERARDLQAERDDAMDTVQALRRKLDFQRRRDQGDHNAAARPYDAWLRKSSRALGLGSPDNKYVRHSAAGELYRHNTGTLPAADELSSYHQRLAEIRARE